VLEKYIYIYECMFKLQSEFLLARMLELIAQELNYVFVFFIYYVVVAAVGALEFLC
jgi:hypothetical protein